jgi:heterodisulfide reductase subunit B
VSYVFFPGCSLEGTARDFGISTEAVARALGLELPELPDWICCGATPAHQSDPLLATALPAKNLLAAGGKTVAVACAACYSRLKAANHEIAADPAVRKKVAQVVGADYDGQTPVRHLLEILVRDLGTARIAEGVVRPLAGLKVVCYYGCLLARPPEVTQFDDAENPTLMDQVMSAAGATVIDWPHKTECCGGSYSVTDVDIVLMLTRDVLSMARLAGADCIVTACPLCQINLDMRQRDVADKYGDFFDLPVFYFTQLLGLAMGLTPKALRLASLVVDPTALLAARGIVPGPAAPAAVALSGKAHT